MCHLITTATSTRPIAIEFIVYVELWLCANAVDIINKPPQRRMKENHSKNVASGSLYASVGLLNLIKREVIGIRANEWMTHAVHTRPYA